MSTVRQLRTRLALALAVCAAVLTLPVGAQAATLPDGRPVSPAGTLTSLRAYPTGAAVTPDGRTALVIAGTLLAGDTGGTQPGAGAQLYVVDTATGLVRQSIDLGDAFGSVVLDRAGTTAYVAGGSTNTVHVLTEGPAGSWTAARSIYTDAFVAGVLLTPDGSHLWAAEPTAGAVVEIDPVSGAVLGRAPAAGADGLAISADGATLYVTNWRGSDVTRIDTASRAVSQIAVGDHPSAIARTADGHFVVADANDATIATITPGRPGVAFTRLALIGRASDSPNAVVAGPDGRVYVSLGGDDAVAVLAPTRYRRHGGRGWHRVGLIPTGWYPDGLAIDPAGTRLEIVSARGTGQGLLDTAPTLSSDPTSVIVNGAYATVGSLQSLTLPDRQIAHDTATVDSTLAPPTPDPQSPILLGGDDPIKHVIYITRENKTYDADLGDLHPGPDNALTLFGQPVTPNLHALERTFSEAQNFSYLTYASQTGHMWEDAGMASDYEDRANGTGNLDDSWHEAQNYPASGLLVEQALHAGRTVRTYNEELAQQSGLFPAEYQAPTSVFPNYDLKVSDTSREAGWETEFRQFEAHHCTGELAAAYGSDCSLPDLEYVYLGEDHTTVVDKPGYPSIQAQVADNDYATGKLIDTLSHSPDWASTVVIVVEDDPQGTGDLSSAYHGFIAIAGPWVKRNYISHVPYNLTSVIGAIDHILGLAPLTDYAVTSRPLDDLFTGTPNCAPYTVDASGQSLFPFTALPGVPPTSDLPHGVTSFAAPDHTLPALTGPATVDQLARTHALGSFANPATFAASQAAAASAASDHPYAACR